MTEGDVDLYELVDMSDQDGSSVR